MEYFVQQLINGITLGSIYGLIAIGYTMVYGIIGMVNFAHGDVFMVSAFIALIAFLILTTWLGISSIALALFIVLIVAMVFTSLINWVDRACGLPAVARLVPAGAADLRDRHVDLPVEFRAGDARAAQQIDPADGAGRVRAVQYATISRSRCPTSSSSSGASPPCCCWRSGIWWRRPGSAGRSAPASRTRRWRRLLGVDVDRTISMTFVIAAALAAVAGTMYLMYYGVVSFSDGFVPGVKAFTAAVLGGIGSLPGAVVGGLLIGLIETLWSAYFSIDYKDVAAFSVLAITLIFLPQGLFGRPDVEKV